MRLHLVECTSSPLLLTTATRARGPPPTTPRPCCAEQAHTASPCSGGELLQHVYSGGKLLRRRYKIFYLRKKCWPAFQNVCVGLPSHLWQAGKLPPYLLPTLGIILLSKASQKKNKCHFDLHFSGDLRLDISSLVTLLWVCLTFLICFLDILAAVPWF